jgi:hypothetical protein
VSISSAVSGIRPKANKKNKTRPKANKVMVL